MKQSKMTKIVAIFALFWIIISVIWTWILVFYEMYFSSNNTEVSLTQEQLQEIIKSYSWTTWSWELVEDNLKNLTNK